VLSRTGARYDEEVSNLLRKSIRRVLEERE